MMVTDMIHINIFIIYILYIPVTFDLCYHNHVNYYKEMPV